MKKKNNFKAKGRMNHEQNLKFMLTALTSGPNGWKETLSQLVVNSLDAGAENVHIWYEDNGAFCVGDDGRGFGEEGVNSAMSYGVSSQDRNDVKTTGANGTGLKHILAMGKNLKKAKISIESASRDLPRVTTMEIDFAYLLALARGKADTNAFVGHDQEFPKNWVAQIGRPLGTGSTVRLHDYDGRKLRSPETIVDNLATNLTPKAVEKVYVLVGEKYKVTPLEPIIFDGENFTYTEEKTKHLGKVEFDLYLGSGSSDSLEVCGPINQIVSFPALMKRLGRDKTSKVPSSWMGVEGYIYIENANKWRLHDGTFDPKFFSDPCDEFLELLDEVGTVIAERLDELKKIKQVEKQKTYLRQIAAVNQDLYDVVIPKNVKGVIEAEISASKRLLYNVFTLRPKSMQCVPGGKYPIILQDLGNTGVDFTQTQWKADPKFAELSGISGGEADLEISDQLGVFKIELTNKTFPKGEAFIQIDVTDPEDIRPSISGSAKVYPDSVNVFRMQNFKDASEVKWGLRKVKEKMPRAVRIEEPKEGKNAQIICEKGCGANPFYVIAKHKNKQIAKKRIDIVERSDDHPIIISIGGTTYVITIGSSFPAIAHVIPDWMSDEGSDSLPQIQYNPNVEILSQRGGAPIDKALAGIATAAFMRKVADGEIDYTKALSSIDAFIFEMKANMFAGKAKYPKA